jgi:hypothetical protein
MAICGAICTAFGGVPTVATSAFRSASCGAPKLFEGAFRPSSPRRFLLSRAIPGTCILVLAAEPSLPTRVAVGHEFPRHQPSCAAQAGPMPHPTICRWSSSYAPPLSENHPSALNILSVEAFGESGSGSVIFSDSNRRLAILRRNCPAPVPGEPVTGGRHRPEPVVVFNRNDWSSSTETAGRHQPVCAPLGAPALRM